ncbi:MAG: ArsA family ATPase [Treponema sp.]|nr:ArsA family ATPase [Treponema sp.]
MRIIIYTGKGGVGKTSIAAATALAMAKSGKRTLVASTDAAHSLSDSFDEPIQNEPTLLRENLWGTEIDCLYETEKNWGAVRTWIMNAFRWAQLDDISAEEMIVFPGFDELFSLLEINRQAESGNYDAIIVDCAPTGETLRLLSYPEMISWWLKKMFPVQKTLIKLVRPFSKAVTGGLEMPGDEVLADIASFAEKLVGLQKLITNSDITSVRIVVNPEKMVIAEARRAFTYLNLYGFNTDAVIINKIFPEEATTGYWSYWRDTQIKHIENIRDCFNPVKILSMPLMETEAFGIQSLEKIAEIAFAGCDIGEVLYRGATQTVRKENENYILELAIPFVSREQVSMSQKGEELTIQAGSYKRKVLIPRVLLGKKIMSAKLAGQKLVISFMEDKANEK